MCDRVSRKDTFKVVCTRELRYDIPTPHNEEAVLLPAEEAVLHTASEDDIIKVEVVREAGRSRR
jgi:hypothetical protein